MSDTEIAWWKVIDLAWCAVDPLHVWDAAGLITGFDPNKWKRADNLDPEKEDAELRERTWFTAITNAINAGKLKATIRRDARLQAWDEYPNTGEGIRDLCPKESGVIRDALVFEPHVIYCEAPDWTKTTIDRQDLMNWLDSKGFRPKFFFPDAPANSQPPATPDYLNPDHPHYALSMEWTGERLAKRRAELEADGCGEPVKRLAQETGLHERTIRRRIESYKKTEPSAAAGLQSVWPGMVTRHRLGE